MQKEFFEALEEKGLKRTKQREIIYDVLYKSEIPLTAEQIYLALKDQKRKINLSTVYRNLDSFVQENIFKVVNLGSDTQLFEFNRNQHKHYLICTECKKIVPITDCPLKEYEKNIEEKTGFEISGHNLYLYGCCKECQEKSTH